MENKYKKIILMVFLLLLIITLMFFYFQKKDLNSNQTNPCSLDVSSLNVLEGTYYSVDDFVNNVSTKCKVSFLDENMQNYKDVGQYKITIIAVEPDKKETQISKQAILRILENKTKEIDVGELISYIPKDMVDLSQNVYANQNVLETAFISKSLKALENKVSLDDLKNYLMTNYNKTIDEQVLSSNLHYDNICYAYDGAYFEGNECDSIQKFLLEKTEIIQNTEEQIILETYAIYSGLLDNGNFNLYDFDTNNILKENLTKEEVDNYFNENNMSFPKYQHTFIKKDNRYIWMKTEKV